MNALYRARYRAVQTGFTLVELMVALALGLVLLVGLVTLFANQSVARGEIDKASRQIESARFAVQMLVDEVHAAGYYGPVITAPTSSTVPNPCSTALSDVKASLGVPLQGYAGDTAANMATTLSCLSGYKANTAVLVVRHAETASTAAFTSGEFNIQISGCQSDGENAYVLSDSTTNDATIFKYHKRPSSTTACSVPATTAADIAPLYVRIYYVAKCSNKDDCSASDADSVPTLKRVDVKSTGTSITPLVDGIENLQLDYGIDNASSDGNPDVYTNTSSHAGIVPADLTEWNNVVSLRIHVLARNVDATGTYTDTKAYALGPVSVSAANDHYKRHAYSELARLNNVAGRRE